MTSIRAPDTQGDRRVRDGVGRGGRAGRHGRGRVVSRDCDDRGRVIGRGGHSLGRGFDGVGGVVAAALGFGVGRPAPIAELGGRRRGCVLCCGKEGG
jgi:hypothetical protein